MNVRRILIVTNRVPYPLHDGGALAMDAMIRGYRNAGMQVHVLAMNTVRHFVATEKIRTLYPDIEGFEAVRFDNALRPLHLVNNLLFSRDPEHAARFYDKTFEAKLLAVLQRFSPDVIQMESPFLSAYLPAIRKQSQALTVLRMHNVEYQVWQRLGAETGGLKGAYLRKLARRMRLYEERVWAQYDLLLPITETDAAIVRNVNAQLPVLTTPFGIDLTAQEPPAAVPDFTRAYHVGAMDWLPNVAAVDWLLQDIWPSVKAKVPAATFHFAGRHMPDSFHHNLPAGAFCAGEVPSVTVFKKDKGVLLVPLRSGGGIRVKILEAMAAGKLVISTDVGIQGIDAVDGVHYLRANTPGEFADAMYWCNQQPQQAREMITSARAMVAEQYNLRTIMDQVIHRLLRETVGE